MAGTIDDIFYRDFNQMMNTRKSMTGIFSLQDLVVPDAFKDKSDITAMRMLAMHNIDDEYYSKLNDTGAYWWIKPKLLKRKFDSKGEFIIENDNYVAEEVTLPQSCVSVLSSIPINVPLKYKAKESFSYVDFLKAKEHNQSVIRYIYIIPKKYCFLVNQSALFASINKPTRKSYSSMRLALTNGYWLYLVVAPYNPTRVAGLKVLATGFDPTDLFDVANDLVKEWIKIGYCFNPADCEMFDCSKGVTNAACMTVPGGIEFYESQAKYSLDKEIENVQGMSLDFDSEETDDIWEGVE